MSEEGIEELSDHQLNCKIKALTQDLYERARDRKNCVDCKEWKKKADNMDKEHAKALGEATTKYRADVQELMFKEAAQEQRIQALEQQIQALKQKNRDMQRRFEAVRDLVNDRPTKVQRSNNDPTHALFGGFK